MRFARLPALVILALTLLAMPLVTQAQPSGRVPRIGYLGTTIEAFDRGLKERGYEDGKNIIIERRSAAPGDLARLPALRRGACSTQGGRHRGPE
jgi:hypothetical protein